MQRLITEPWLIRLAREITADLSRSAQAEHRRLVAEALEEIDKLDLAIRTLDGLSVHPDDEQGRSCSGGRAGEARGTGPT